MLAQTKRSSGFSTSCDGTRNDNVCRQASPALELRDEGVSPKLKLFLDVMYTLVEQDIQVALINGYDLKARSVGRDVDLLVRKKDVDQIIHICNVKGNQNGWQYVSGRWVGHWLPAGLYQIVFHRVDDNNSVQNLVIDLICTDGLAAGVVPVYSPSLLDTDRKLYDGLPTTPIGSYTKTLIRVLAGDPKGILQVEGLGYVPEHVKPYIESLLGSSFLAHYERSVAEKKLLDEWKSLRKQAQQSYFLRHPFKCCKNFCISLGRRAVGTRLGHVPTIAIVGPDGVGKSTAIAKASHFLEHAFITIRSKHWRPKLLPNIADLSLKKLLLRSSTTEAESEVSTAPRRQAGPLSVFRIIYYYTDYLLGHAVKDRLYLEPNILINLYDRCSLDMYVDPVRYGLRESKLNFLIYRFSPKPDRIILLSDSAEAISARKSELAHHEIARQTELWTKLYQQGFVHEIIQVGGRGADDIARDIATAVLKCTAIPQTVKR